MARLPVPGSDDGKWGQILNEYLSQSLDESGQLKAGIITGIHLADGSITSAKLATGAVSKVDVGLSNVDNTSDVDKPISSATQIALNTKLPTLDLDTQVATKVATNGSDTKSALLKSFNAMPEAYIDPRSLTPGMVNELTFGDFIASYGNSPASVSGGNITHSPLTGSNSAAYIEGRLSGLVGRLGMEIEWPSGSDGTFALVVPSSDGWSGSPTPGDSGVHATVRADGVISCGRYVNGTVVGTQSTSLGILTGRHSFEVLIDSSRQEISVIFDGVLVLRYQDAIAFSYLSDRVIWELFQANGTAGTPGYIRAAWGDTEKIIPTSRTGTSLERVRKAYAVNVSGSTTINLSTTYRATLAVGTISAYFPPSGRLLCRYRVWVTANTLATNRRVFGSIASAADQALLWGGQTGAAFCEIVITGTPGTLTVLTPQMWAEDSSGTVTVTVNGSSGVAMLSALPVESII